jgi:hypothetical protein
MSDAPQNSRPFSRVPRFLRRVIDGAFDRVSPLEPRRPSRFEPPTIGIVDALADGRHPWGGEPEPPGRAVVADGVQSPPRPRMPDLDATLQPVRPQRDLDERSSRPNANRAERSTPSPIPAPIERDARPRSARTDGDSPLALDPSLVRRPVRPIASTPEPAQARPPAPLLQARIERLEPAAQPKRVHREPVTPVRDRSNRAVVEPVNVASPTRREWLQAHTAATPAPEPVVNVTIGRIEVRLAPAARAQARQRADGPKPMGLDQYLRQRGGRR